MLYLLDANVLITANRQYYPINRIPEFWDWLVHMGALGNVKIPQEVYEEFNDGEDELSQWANQDEVQSALLFSEAAEIANVRSVISNGYAPDLTDDELEKVGRDPFLVSYALIDSANRMIITTEVSKPSRTRANRHLPDVCGGLGIHCQNTFHLLTALDFKTGWKG